MRVRPIVECVPNVSEGRRPEVIAALVAVVQAVPGVTLLDHGMDADHNRSVFTFVGAPAPVEEAAFRLAREASTRIDLGQHEGVHPRIGAADVIPFVPLGDTPMETCVAMTGRVGRRIGDELGIPVFLYERAAPVPGRGGLADLRRGGLVGLARRMADDPVFRPDFGPPRLHPTAGAVAVGARYFLVAFNVELESDDLDLAKRIASAVRASSGGLSCVKALGLPLHEKGTVQVSMNLIDFRETSIGRAYREIESRARAAGVAVRGSELIGLVPRAALEGSLKDAIGLDLDRTRVIEERLRDAVAGPVHVHGFLEDVSSTHPSPGGGAAAALAGALAAASAGKVVNLVRHKPRFAEVRDELDLAWERLHGLRWELLDLLEQDAAAFQGFADACKLSKKTEADRKRRQAAIEAAAVAASETPLAIARAALEVLRAASAVGERAGASLMADLYAAAALGRGTIDACYGMLCANLPSIRTAERAASLRSAFAAVREEARKLQDDLESRFAG